MTTPRCLVALLTLTLTALLTANRLDAQMKATMTAKLVDAEKKAAQRAATVEITTTGVELTDPAMSNEKPVVGQGHLHYQVDKGPVIATPAAKLSFHELAPGPHTITVVLAGNDHKPLGPQQVLNVTVPKAMTTAAAPSGAAPTAGATPTTKAPDAAPGKKGY